MGAGGRGGLRRHSERGTEAAVSGRLLISSDGRTQTCDREVQQREQVKSREAEEITALSTQGLPQAPQAWDPTGGQGSRACVHRQRPSTGQLRRPSDLSGLSPSSAPLGLSEM